MVKSNPAPMAGEGFKERFEEFKKTKWAIPIGLAITIVVCIVLLLTTWYMCFSYAIIAILAFAIPYYFGMTGLKKLALFGLVLFVILGVSFGIYTADFYKNLEGDPVSSSDDVLTNGTMESIGGDEFKYQVFLADGNGSEEVVVLVGGNFGAVLVHNETMDPWGSSTSEGQLYGKNLTVEDDDLYTYRFGTSVDGDEGTKWVYTISGIGPLRMPQTDFVISWIISDILVVFLNIGILFFILLGIVFWTKSSRKRYENIQRERDQLGLPEEPPDEIVSDEKFVCSECGMEVPADATECPQCGEVFEDESEPVQRTEERLEGTKCPHCGADVETGDRKCWNCGERL
jgi:hypothetical protein